MPETPPPERVVVPAWIAYPKEDVFEVCGALAIAEVLLRRAGRRGSAERMAAVLELVEAGLAR